MSHDGGSACHRSTTAIERRGCTREQSAESATLPEAYVRSSSQALALHGVCTPGRSSGSGKSSLGSSHRHAERAKRRRCLFLRPAGATLLCVRAPRPPTPHHTGTWPCGGGRTPQHGRGSHVPASARPCPRRPRGMCALFSRSSVPATRCRRPGARPSTEGGRHNSHAARRSIWLALWRAASGAPRLGRARRAAGRQRTHRTSLGRARCLRPARSLLARRAQPLAGTVRLCASGAVGSKRPLRQVGVHPRGQRSWRGRRRVGAAKAAQLGRGHARATLYMTPRAAAGPYAPQSSFFFKPNVFFFWSASFGGPISLPQPLCTFLVARLGVVRQRPPGGERRKGGGAHAHRLRSWRVWCAAGSRRGPCHERPAPQQRARGRPRSLHGAAAGHEREHRLRAGRRHLAR